MKVAKYVKGEKRVFRHSRNNPKNLNHVKRKPREANNKEVEKKTFVNTIDLRSNKKLLQHLEKTLNLSKKDFTKKEIFSIIYQTLKTIGERTVRNEAGVFIKDFGYFCVVRYPQRRIMEGFVQGRKKKYMNFQTNGFPHSITFISIRKDNLLKEWVMERAFHKYHTTRIMSELLKEGKKYKMNFSLLYNLYGNRVYTVDVIKK
jgi:hypothetical protein